MKKYVLMLNICPNPKISKVSEGFLLCRMECAEGLWFFWGIHSSAFWSSTPPDARGRLGFEPLLSTGIQLTAS